MPYLSIEGIHLDPDRLNKILNIPGFKVWRIGEFTNQLKNRTHSTSSIGQYIGKGIEFDIRENIEQSYEFLQNNFEKLIILKKMDTIDDFNLHFSFNLVSNKFAQSFSFPSKFVELCGKLGISIEVTCYEE